MFGLRLRAALVAIGLGVATAGVVVTALSVLGIIGAVIAGVGIMALTAWSYLRR